MQWKLALLMEQADCLPQQALEAQASRAADAEERAVAADESGEAGGGGCGPGGSQA